MTILHKDIADADRHEPKGITSASAGQVYVADGANSGDWTSIIIPYTASLSPAAVAANTTAEQTFTVSGVAAADVILSITKPTAQAGLGIVGWRVESIHNVCITFSNNTASPITPTASQTYTITVLKA